MYKYWEIWVICANEAIYHFMLITVYDESATKHWCLKLSVRTISNNVDYCMDESPFKQPEMLSLLDSYNVRTVSDTCISRKLYSYWRLLLSVFVWITHLCLYSCEQTGSCRVKAHYNFCGEWTLAICHNHGEGWGQCLFEGACSCSACRVKSSHHFSAIFIHEKIPIGSFAG